MDNDIQAISALRSEYYEKCGGEVFYGTLFLWANDNAWWYNVEYADLLNQFEQWRTKFLNDI